MSINNEISRFSCRIDNIKTFTEILNCLCVNLRKDHPCAIEISTGSFNVIITGSAKSTQGRVSFHSGYFDDYIFKPINEHDSDEKIRIFINLTTFVDCLLLFGSSLETTAGTITYNSEDALFKLSLEDSGILTTCDISTLYMDNNDDIGYELFSAFLSSNELCQVILKSEILKEAMHDLSDVYGATTVAIEITKNPENLTFMTVGTMGECEIEFPRLSDLFISFRCDKSSKWTYPLTSLQLGMKALNISKETFLRMNEEGVICIQHQIETNRGHEIYIDYLMVSDVMNENLYNDNQYEDNDDNQ